MNWYRNLVNGLLPPPAFASQEAWRVHRLFINSSFLTAFFALSYCLMSIYMSGYYFAIAMVVSVIVFLSLPFILKAGVDVAVLSHVYIGLIAVVYCLLIYWDGGIRRANVTPWIVLLPATAMMIRGVKAAIFWLMIGLIIVGVFEAFYYADVVFPICFDVDKDQLFNVLSMAGLLCIISFIIFISETGKREAQMKLEEQNHALEKMNIEKNSFLSIVAHDLKNPLASVRAFAEISANDKTTPEKRKTYLQYIAVSADRMFELIKNLLDINMIESGKLGLKPDLLCLNEMVQTYLQQVGPVAQGKQITMVPQLPEKKIYFNTDKARLEQILENFISNAMKYSPAKTSVYVKLFETEQHIEISVKDEGPGISQEEIGKLFKQYSVVSSIPREGEHAMGLGLAIVKKIADAFGATVGCESEKGKGCMFYIRFPKVAADNLS